MDDRPYTNGFHTSDEQWFVLLRQTGLDRWDEEDRRSMKADLAWARKHRVSEGARRRLQTTLIAGAFVIVAAFISWIAPWKNPPICPPSYVCTQTPIPTPTP